MAGARKYLGWPVAGWLALLRRQEPIVDILAEPAGCQQAIEPGFA
jgi:hypothetical protein